MKTITSIALLAASSSLVSCTIPNPGPAYKTTLFSDDFNGAAGSAPSTSKWIYDLGTSYPGGPPGWGSYETEYYTNQRSTIQMNGNGYLLITPRRSSSGNWTSARIETVQTNFQAPAGGKMKVEARLQVPDVTGDSALGYWPAFWMLGGNFRGNYQNWPAVGEIDIMESINGVSYVTQGIHCDVNPGGVCNESSGLGADDSCGGSSCVGAFHTYTAVINRKVSPETITFYVDNVAMKTITETQLGTQIWAQTIHHGYYMLLNVAIGGGYPSAIAGFTTPTSSTKPGVPMKVDYVAVWTT